MTRPLRSVTAETTVASLRRDLRALHAGVLDDTILTKVRGWSAAVNFVVGARAAGWCVCEMIPLVAIGVYWFCAHPSGRCRGPGIVLWQVCPYCNERYSPRRADQRTCGRARCRQRHHRGHISQLVADLGAEDERRRG
jgi:hypothetical protein